MTDKVNRRTALGIGAVAPVGWSLPIGGEIDTTTQGINIKLMWFYNSWHVVVPDFEDTLGHTYWRPGMAIQWKRIPLEEYLSNLEEYFEMKPGVKKRET